MEECRKREKNIQQSIMKQKEQGWIVIIMVLQDTPPVVWSEKGKKFPCGSEPSLWPWPWGQQSKIAPQHSGSWWRSTIPTLLQEDQKLRRYGRNSWVLFLFTVTLTLKIEIQTFHITFRVMMMHPHIMFGCIQFSGSEDIFRTKVRQMDTQTTWFQHTPTHPLLTSSLGDGGGGV